MTRDLAERVGCWATDFSPTAPQLARIRASVRDFMGCVVAGTRRSELRPALWLAHGGTVPVWGLPDSFDPAGAALVCGTAGSLLQLHDIYVPAGMHPSSTVIPAAWSALHGAGARRRDIFVRAVAAGYESANRFALACSPGQGLAGSSATATGGAIGAAVAAALIAGLNARAIGFAIANAALLMQAAPTAAMRAHGTLAPLHSGLAARAGYEAATLARAGGAGRHILEGDPSGSGLMGLLRGQPQSLQPEAWHGETIDDVCWKYFPACFFSLVAIEAALQIPLANRDHIGRVSLRLPNRMLALVGHGPRGAELYDRLMSVRWGVACALLHGSHDMDRAIEPDNETLALAQRIEVVHAPELDRLLPDTLSADLSVYSGHEHVQLAYRRNATRGPPKTDLPTGSSFVLDDTRLRDKFSVLTRAAPAVADDLAKLLAALPGRQAL